MDIVRKIENLPADSRSGKLDAGVEVKIAHSSCVWQRKAIQEGPEASTES
jgi:hypothetical protein